MELYKCSSEEWPRLCDEAAKLWAKVFPPTRKSGTNRETRNYASGLSKPRGTNTEAQFRRKRRVESEALVQANGHVLKKGRRELRDAAAGATLDNINPDLVDKLRKIEAVAKVEAAADGTILEHECTVEHKIEAEIQMITDILNARKRATDEGRKTSLRTENNGKINVSNTIVYLEKDVRGNQDVAEFIRTAGIQIVSIAEVCKAHWILTAVPATTVGKKAKLAAIIMGRTVCSPQYLLTHGMKGNAMAFTRSANTKRHIWITDGFNRTCRSTASVIVASAAEIGSQWRLVSTKADFLDRVAKDSARPRRQQRRYDVLGIATKEEKDGEFKEFANVFDIASLLDFLDVLDHPRCKLGYMNK